jgi:hypothetical protein
VYTRACLLPTQGSLSSAQILEPITRCRALTKRGRRAQQSAFRTKECALCTHVEAEIAVPAPSPPSARGHVWMPNALFSICTCTYLRDWQPTASYHNLALNLDSLEGNTFDLETGTGLKALPYYRGRNLNCPRDCYLSAKTISPKF